MILTCSSGFHDYIQKDVSTCATDKKQNWVWFLVSGVQDITYNKPSGADESGDDSEVL